MTDEERLAKNRRIAKTKQETKQKRKSQVCRVYRIKIDLSHLNKAQILRLQMIFVEAKWLYNDTISFMNDHDVNEYDPQKLTVQGLDKDRNPVTHELQYITSQMRIAVVDDIKNSLKSLSSKKKRHRKTGKLRYKSDYASINLKQYGITYRFYDSILVEESERLKKCQRLIARRKKGSNNIYKARKLLRKAYQRLNNKKHDAANKIVHELLEHEHVYMQDENLKGWHKGLFGRTVQHSVLGLIKAKLMKNERVTVLPSSKPTTKYCPNCGGLKKDITLADRVYECECVYSEDRNIHAARNMIFLSKKNTCGTQEINAFGEDVQNIAAQPH